MKKQFKVIDNEDDFNKLLDDLGTRSVRHLYEKSQYEMYLDGILENIKVMGNNIIVKKCIEMILSNGECELKPSYYNCNNITKGDLILRDFVKFVYDKCNAIFSSATKYDNVDIAGVFNTKHNYSFESKTPVHYYDTNKSEIDTGKKLDFDFVAHAALYIQMYLQNIIHINYIRNGDIDNSIDTLTILDFDNDGDKISSSIIRTTFFKAKCHSCPSLSDIISLINKYPLEFKEIDDCIRKFDLLESNINIRQALTVNGVVITSLKKNGLSINKALLTKLFLFYIKNTGQLRQAFIHLNSQGENYNNNMLYVHSDVDKCYRYLEVEESLTDLAVKITSRLPFASLDAKKDDDFIYNCTKSVNTVVQKELTAKKLEYRLREPLKYTAFAVDNGTVILNKLTGEFIFCENLFSERLMFFVKYKGNFDKDFFVNHYKEMDNPLLRYTKAKIKNGLNEDGTVNKDVYGLLAACTLNLFQHDVDTHNAVVFLGQHGTGKTLLINALKKLDSLQVNAKFSMEVGLTEYMNTFLNRDLEKYHRTFKSEFPVKEYNENATMKVVLERGSISINQKYRDAVVVDVNSKPVYTGEEFMRINVDGGLKDRFVLFEMRDKSKDTFFDIEGVDNIEDFLEYNITHTLCGFYDGFMFQLDNKVFNSDGRIYSRLFMKYNPNTYNSFIERVSHIGGIDLILDIDENGILNQADLKNLVKICDECGYDTDIKKVARQTLLKNLNKLRDYNSQSRIFNSIDFKNTKESTLKKYNTTFKRQPYSLGIKFRDSVLDEIMSRLVNDKQRYKNQIKELEDIISRHNSYTKDDLRYIAKKYINDITIKDLDNDTVKDEPKSDIENTISEIQSIGLRKA